MGVDPMTNESWVPFGIHWLSYGVPFLGAVIMIYALPLLWSGHDRCLDISMSQGKNQLPRMAFAWPSAVRGSLVGFLAGFIPTLSYSISSKIAWLAEKRRYSSPIDIHSIRRVVAAESANNAAALSALIPLLLFGIPLVASEVVLYNMLTAQGHHLGATALDRSLILSLSAAFIIANLVGFLAAWPLASLITDLLRRHQMKINIMITAMLISVFLYEGLTLMQIDIYMVLGFVLLGLGWMLRRYDTQPVIFGFVISDFITHTASLMMQKYSF
jgi:putative tricarboxylic transport membrane protein